MALKGNLLEPVLSRMESLLSQHDAPAALRGPLLGIALRVPPNAHTSTLADAVVAGLATDEHLDVREACIAAIETLKYELLHERAQGIVSALLRMQPLRLVETGARYLRKRVDEMSDGTLVEPHLGMVLKAMMDEAEETNDRIEIAFVLAETFSSLCVRSHADSLGRLLQHADTSLRRKAFGLMASGYKLLCGMGHQGRFGHPRLSTTPPLFDVVADAMSDSDHMVRSSAQEAVGNALSYLPPGCDLPRQKILAALLEFGHTWDGDRVSGYVRVVQPELQERMRQGDDALRLKVLKLVDPKMCYDEDLLEAIERIIGEGSLSARLAATSIINRVAPEDQEPFDDGYMSLDFGHHDGSFTDEEEDEMNEDADYEY